MLPEVIKGGRDEEDRVPDEQCSITLTCRSTNEVSGETPDQYRLFGNLVVIWNGRLNRYV